MSKLIFPDRGGVLVDDRAEVVRIVQHSTRRGLYVIAVVKYPTLNRPYDYHYLDPSGGVTGGNSGNSYDAEDALGRALHSIRELEARARRARRSPTQKEVDKLKKKIDFFLKNAYPNDLKAARDRARAEKFAQDSGWEVEWEYDQEEYQMGDAETEPPSEVLVAILRDADRNVIGSLGGIGDPSREYRRVVEAELASEAMHEMTR